MRWMRSPNIPQIFSPCVYAACRCRDRRPRLSANTPQIFPPCVYAKHCTTLYVRRETFLTPHPSLPAANPPSPSGEGIGLFAPKYCGRGRRPRRPANAQRIFFTVCLHQILFVGTGVPDGPHCATNIFPVCICQTLQSPLCAAI